MYGGGGGPLTLLNIDENIGEATKAVSKLSDKVTDKIGKVSNRLNILKGTLEKSYGDIKEKLLKNEMLKKLVDDQCFK